MKSMTFKFWVTLEFSRCHGNLKPKRFDFCIEYKPIDRIWLFHYQWLELFGLLEEIGISSQSLNLGGRRGTTDDVATIPFHPSLSSAALRESPNPIPVYSLMLSSHLFFCLPFLLAPFTVPCRIVFAMPEDLEMWPYHLSFRFLFQLFQQ